MLPLSKECSNSCNRFAHSEQVNTIEGSKIYLKPGDIISIKDLLQAGKSIYNAVIRKPDPKDHEIMASFQQKHEEKQDKLAKEHNSEVRKIIEERKKEILQNRTAESVNHEESPREQTDNLQIEQNRQQQKQEMLQSAKEKYMENKRQQEHMISENWAISRTRGQRERG